METYTLAITDEQSNVRHQLSGLSLDMARREAIDWVEIYQERGWTLGTVDRCDDWTLTKGPRTVAMKMRGIQIWSDEVPSLRDQWPDLMA